MDILQANQLVHSKLIASGDYLKSPHLFPENKSRVRKLILNLINLCPARQKLIDFGCGTGFMLELTNDLFSELYGVDITQDMLDLVDTSCGNIILVDSVAEDTPFDADSFDFATAYSFMDHLADYRAFLREAYRILKNGGIFYSDLNPNREFITSLETLSAKYSSQDLNALLLKEINGALRNGEFYQNNFAIDADILDLAEPGKSVNKGFDAREVVEAAYEIGFSDVKVEHHWFLGQAKVQNTSQEAAECIESFLHSLMPHTSNLFKYHRYILKK